MPIPAADHHDLVRGRTGELLEYIARGPGGDRHPGFCSEGNQRAVVVEEEETALTGSVVIGQLILDRGGYDLFGTLDLDRPRITEPGQEVSDPSLDIVAHQPLLHGPVPLDLLFLRHGERHLDRLDHRILIIRVDDDRFPEFLGRPGHLREDEHPGAVGPCGDVLLCHQVHAVPERSHQSDVGDAVERHQRLEREEVVEVVDRCPVGRPVLPVDPADEFIDLLLQHLVTADAGPGRDCDKDERDLSLVTGLLLKQRIERLKPERDPLRVVQAVE